MQRTGEMFGVRTRVWLGALVSAAIICLTLQIASRKEGSVTTGKRTPHSGQSAVNAESISPALSVATFPSNGFDPAFAELLQQLSDPEPSVRLSAVEALEGLEMSTNERVALLTASLSDSDARVRAHAALRLGSFRVAAIDAVPTLKQLAQSETDDVVRARVKDALYNIRMYDYSPFMRDQ